MPINELLTEFTPLLHKTMQRLNIRVTHMDYDDFFQELQIKLIHVYQTFDGEPLRVSSDRYRFTAYAGKGLYWHGLNLIRKDNAVHTHSLDSDQLEWFTHKDEEPAAPLQSSLFIEDFLQQAKKRLSPKDHELFLYLLEDTYTIQQLANMLKVSRDTIYKRKQKIQERLHGVKECLIH